MRCLLSCVTIFIVACLCLTCVGILSAGVFLLGDVGNPQVGGVPQAPAPSWSAPTPAYPGPADAAPTPQVPAAPESISPVIAAQMDSIEADVMALRGLPHANGVRRVLLTPDQLRQRVLSDFLADYTPEEAANDSVVLWAFGLLPKEYDLLNLYRELLSEQVAGFYDDDERAMFVVQGQGFLGPQRMTYAHEYVHALQDAAYDIDDGLGFNDAQCDADSERCAAIQALLEGDASLTEQFWLYQHATPEDMQEIMDFYSQYSSPVYDSAPAFLQEDFLFPYTAGKDFVQALYNKGGWDAVDAAYLTPPVSTEQILHPEKYGDDVPQVVTLPNLQAVLGTDWEQLDAGIMGEWYTYLLMARANNPVIRQSDANARHAAAGWDGDAYAVYRQTSGEAVALAFSLVWDTPEDAGQFREIFGAYLSERTGAKPTITGAWKVWRAYEGVHALRADADATVWLFAPDEATLEALQVMFP
ncbi:MAG: hypothetical protein OHK0052_09390 [Anaerolineales bacterium]